MVSRFLRPAGSFWMFFDHHEHKSLSPPSVCCTKGLRIPLHLLSARNLVLQTFFPSSKAGSLINLLFPTVCYPPASRPLRFLSVWLPVGYTDNILGLSWLFLVFSSPRNERVIFVLHVVITMTKHLISALGLEGHKTGAAMRAPGLPPTGAGAKSPNSAESLPSASVSPFVHRFFPLTIATMGCPIYLRSCAKGLHVCCWQQVLATMLKSACGSQCGVSVWDALTLAGVCLQVSEMEVNGQFESVCESVFSELESQAVEALDLPMPGCFRMRSHSYVRAIEKGCSQDDECISLRSSSPPRTTTTVRTIQSSTGE